ncbi:tetratricopeptide repeat protein [Orbaceae bacterium ESL0721]|nr:tetratricopeptide repeat protein [Orbaceae bacterium ESL0721]
MLIRKIVPILACLILLSACQSKNQFDPEAAALARTELGLGYLAHADESEENIKLAHYNLKRAAEYSPNNPKIMLAMAMFDQHVGEYKEAEMIYKRIILTSQNDGLYHLHFGVFLCARERYSEAEREFEQTILLDRHQWKADALEQYGYCAIQNGKTETADSLFEQLFKYDAKRRDMVLKTAQIYEQRGDSRIANYLQRIAKKK